MRAIIDDHAEERQRNALAPVVDDAREESLGVLGRVGGADSASPQCRSATEMIVSAFHLCR